MAENKTALERRVDVIEAAGYGIGWHDGDRIELANAGARLILAPDWQTVTWTEIERKKGQAWGLKTIESFHSHGMPPASGKA